MQYFFNCFTTFAFSERDTLFHKSALSVKKVQHVICSAEMNLVEHVENLNEPFLGHFNILLNPIKLLGYSIPH